MHIQVIKNAQSSITFYDKTSLTINEKKYNQSVYITRTNIQQLNIGINELEVLSVSNLPLMSNIDLLLMGGRNLSPLCLPQLLQEELSNRNISLEMMPMGAACRTFNLLLSEGRDVGCLILL